ncbi:hypothetical protein [Neorickettsia risticii]|nr:hypothetical protein [Neorickettsia risticii]
MRRVSIRMLQKSILCGFKGATHFLIGAIVATNGAVIRSTVPGGGSGPEKRYGGLYAMYNNIIPTLEVLLCMGVLCVLLERIAFKRVIPDPWVRAAVSLAICVVLMMLICTLLRVFEARRDCCDDYDYDKSFDRAGGYGMHFDVPSCSGIRNSLSVLFPGKSLSGYFAFDRHVPEPADDGYPIVTPGEKAWHCVGALAAAPLWMVMLALNLLELPLVAVLDCAALCTREGRAHPFAGSRDVVRQMLYGVYQIMEPVTCVLPETAQQRIGGAFHAAVRRVMGMPGEGHRSGGGPEGRLENAGAEGAGAGVTLV